MRCDPDNCPNCMYIGEGDSLCDVLQEIVLADWIPTEHYMGQGCPYRRPQRKRRRRKRGGRRNGRASKPLTGGTKLNLHPVRADERDKQDDEARI